MKAKMLQDSLLVWYI